jgi:hypothetical protein
MDATPETIVHDDAYRRLPQFRSDFMRQDRPFDLMPLASVIATGGSSIILGNGTQIIKLAIKKVGDFFEYDLNYWASQSKFGPKFYSWGQVTMTQDDYERLRAFATQKKPTEKTSRELAISFRGAGDFLQCI